MYSVTHIIIHYLNHYQLLSSTALLASSVREVPFTLRRRKSIAHFEHRLFHRHLLFKHGPGSLQATANQDYPLSSSTIYSPPPRPLPRCTFSRPTFIFNKLHKCCNWKCTALSATAVTLMLALLLTYAMGKPLLYFILLFFLFICTTLPTHLSLNVQLQLFLCHL